MEQMNNIMLREMNKKKLNPMSYGGFFKYASLVIKDIEEGKPIKSIKDEHSFLTQEDAEKLKDFLKRRYEDDIITELKSFRFSNNWRWTQIFKGNYSGYTDGLKSKNKGNAVEEKCVEDVEQYVKLGINECKSYVKDLVNLIRKKYPGHEIIGVFHDGGKNQKRELDVNQNGSPYVERGTGKTLTDITLVLQDPKDVSTT